MDNAGYRFQPAAQPVALQGKGYIHDAEGPRIARQGQDSGVFKVHESPMEGLFMRAILKPRSFLFLLLLLVIPAASFAQIAVSVRIGPPALPVFAASPCSG